MGAVQNGRESVNEERRGIMNDLEKVINGLEWCVKEDIGACGKCPYDKNRPNCDIEMMRDAIALLKAQEQEPINASIVDSDGGLMHWWVCGNCQAPINPEDRYCHECGRAVKWDG